MLTSKDMKFLQQNTSRRTRVIIGVLSAAIVVVLVAAGSINLLHSARLAEQAGASLGAIWSDDLSGFTARDIYPRTYVQALDKYMCGILSLGAAVVAATFAILLHRLLNFHGRVLGSLGKGTAQPSDGSDAGTPGEGEDRETE
ncbi:MAG: hypothetical protein ACYSU0_19615 [Planctomycetota bacterium]|jgi:hypothetical protein